MNAYKARTEFINDQLKRKDLGEVDRRLLSNGFIPDNLQEEYNTWMRDMGTPEHASSASASGGNPDPPLEVISNANYFALEPDRIAGKMVPGTGFLNPVITKGNITDVVDTIDKILDSKEKTESMSDEKTIPPTDYTQWNIPTEIREKLEAFDEFTLSDWEYHQYDDLSKKHGKAAALTLIMNGAERDWAHVSKKLATIGRAWDKIDASTSSATKKSGKKYDVIFTDAGGATVASNRADMDKKTKDYRNLAYINKDGTIEYKDKKLPADIIKKIEDMRDAEQATRNAQRDTTKEFMEHGKKEGRIIIGKIPEYASASSATGDIPLETRNQEPETVADANEGPKIEMTRPELVAIIKNNLLDDELPGKKTQTVEETILRYNPGLSDDEIRAWVYYKRRFGNPMRGWEKYFLSGGGGFSTLLQTTADTVIKDNKFTDLRTVPANTILGVKTKFKHEYQSTNYTICKTQQGELVWVQDSHIKEIKHTTSETKADIDALVQAKVLVFDGNEYYPYPVYMFGDIYTKIRQLNDNRDAIVEAYSEELWNDQIAKLREYLPKVKSFRDPIRSNRPAMLCLSEFANDAELFGVLALNEDAGVKLGRMYRGHFQHASEKLSLFDAFVQWIEQTVKDTDLKNTTRADINKYYFAKSPGWPKDEDGKELLKDSQKQELRGNARLAAEELFGEFLASALTFEDSTALDVIWNEKYNAFTSVIQFVDKIPIGFNGSTMFKNGPLDLKPAQRQGLAYLQMVGAGTLAYDVGFGKTLTGILNLAQEISQGAIKRPLIVVPKPTYKNWLKELFGYWISADGQRTEFNEFPGAMYHYGAFSGIAGIKLNDWYNLSGKHYQRLLESNDGDLNKIIPEGTITVVSYKGFEQMGFSRAISQELFDAIAKVLMQKEATEGQSKNEKQDAKDAATFYQDIQGWLGLGNKNAIIRVDEVGFDHISVDEAHNFKNVFKSCGKDPATGRKLFDLSASRSTRAVKMFFITNYIQAKFGKRVVNLTATPFTNSPLEIYSMLSFVGLDTLNQYNLYNIKKFFEQFVLQTIEYAIDAKGEIITKPVIKSFRNLKLLQTILLNHFHYKADPKEAGVVRPCKVDLPNKDITTYLEMNEWQRTNQVRVKEIAKSVSRSDPGAGLRAMALSLDNAFSPFLFGNTTPESARDFVEQSPKIKYAVDCIRTVKEWHEKRGEPCSGIVVYSNRGKSYFDYIKDYLIHEIGFQDNISYDDEVLSEVEIITGGGGESDEDRKELVKDAFNAGVVKIIIGTGTIREGINLQRRGTVLIDLYPEWNPTDIVQLKGRIWRQGNMFGYIRFVMPLVINSMDNFINQKLDEKGKRIASIWAPIGDLNVLENTSDLDPAEIKYQLVDDAGERFKMKYETIKAEIGRQFSILEENKKTILSVDESIEELKAAEEEIYENLLEKKTAWAKILEYLKGLPLVKFRKEATMAKTVKDIERVSTNISDILEAFARYQGERYNIVELLTTLRILRSRDFNVFTDFSLNGRDIGAHLNDLKEYYTFRVFDRDYDNLVGAWAAVRKAEKSVLNAYGKGWMDDISPIVKDIAKKQKAVEMEREAVESDEYKQKILAGINAEMEAAKALRGDLREQVERFASLNHLLSYLNDNTDKENCPIPTIECCPQNNIDVLHADKEHHTPFVTPGLREPQAPEEPVTSNEQPVTEQAEIQEAIDLITEMLPDLKGKDKKEAKEAVELLKEMLEPAAAAA